jgi:hypothetical protein
MRSTMVMVPGLWSFWPMAVAATGCVGGGEHASESIEQVQQAVATGDTRAAPEGINAKGKLPVDRGAASGAGSRVTDASLVSTVIHCDTTFFRRVDVPPQVTLTVWTTDASYTRDPVLAILLRTNTEATLVRPCYGNPYTQQDGFITLAQDDDGYGGDPPRNAKVAWYNSSGDTKTVWVVGFLYGTNPDYGYVTVTQHLGGEVSSVTEYFGANTWKGGLSSGYVFTSGGKDTQIFAVDTTDNGVNGKCNDDCTASTRESCLRDMSPSVMWYFCYGAWFTGDATLNG